MLNIWGLVYNVCMEFRGEKCICILTGIIRLHCADVLQSSCNAVFIPGSYVTPCVRLCVRHYIYIYIYYMTVIIDYVRVCNICRISM